MHKPIRKNFLTIAFLAGFLLFPIIAAAQVRGLKGKVTDEKTGQPIVGAPITIQGMDVVRTLTAKTDKKGEYTYFLGNQAGTYRIIVHAPGYVPQYKENLRPEIQEMLAWDFKLVSGADYKLPWEMTEQERSELQKKNAEVEKRNKMIESIKSTIKLAQQLTAEGKYEEANVEINKAIEKVPAEASLHGTLASNLEKLGKNEDAIAAYQKAISIDPKNSAYSTNLAALLIKLGRSAEAQKIIKDSAAQNPGSAQGYYNLGITLINEGKMAEAAESFKQAITADPTYAESYYQLGIALSGKQENWPAAVEALTKYMSIGKKPDQVDVAKQLIEALKKK
jgi:tetratricopeptide (TPR) repeat protein